MAFVHVTPSGLGLCQVQCQMYGYNMRWLCCIMDKRSERAFGFFCVCVLVIKGQRGSSVWCTVLHGGWFTMLGGVRLLGLLNRGWNLLVWHSYELVQTQTHISFLFLLYLEGSLCLFSFSLYLTVWFVRLSHIHPHKDKHINKYIHCIKPHTWEPACHTGWRGHSQRS